MNNSTFISVNNFFENIEKYDDKMTIRMYGEILGNFIIKLRKKFNNLFKNAPLMKYELFAFYDGDINTLDIFDDSNPIVAQIKLKAYNFSLTIPPCSNKVEYYTKLIFDKLINTDKELKNYINKYFNTVELEHRNTKSNEDSDYYLCVTYKNGHEDKLLGEHKAVSYSPYGKCSAGSTIKNLINDIECGNTDLLHKILFKVDYSFDKNNYIVNNVFIGNFLTRIGINSEISHIFCSGKSAHITSERSVSSLIWNFRCNSFYDVCDYIIDSYNNKQNGKKKYFFIKDNKEYMCYHSKNDNYSFVEIKRTNSNAPYIVNDLGNNILLSSISDTKYKEYKKWTTIPLVRKSNNIFIKENNVVYMVTKDGTKYKITESKTGKYVGRPSYKKLNTKSVDAQGKSAVNVYL